MSRYSKGYGRGKNHGGAGLKFDTLLKACSNSKKPSANRTAGALGRFGIASFTSTRNSNLESTGEEESRFKFLSKRPKYSDSVVNSSAPKSYDVSNSQNSSILQTSSYPVTPITPVYKPRKFFKSRDPVAAQESAMPNETSALKVSRSVSEVIAPIKIPIPKPRLYDGSEKNSKPLRNANNANPPNSQPIKLRIFKDKTTSKLVSVSEAPPPILSVEDIHKPKSEKIQKKRGRKPKHVSAKDCPVQEPSTPPEKKPSGRSTRNSRKYEKDQGQQEHLTCQKNRSPNISLDTSQLVNRSGVPALENSVGENTSYTQTLFLNSANVSSCPDVNTTGVNIEKKLEDDAEFQQLSQMLSSMEEEGNRGYSNTDYGQQGQTSHSPLFLPHSHTPSVSQHLPQLEPPLTQQLHQPIQQLSAQQHLQCNSRQYSEFASELVNNSRPVIDGTAGSLTPGNPVISQPKVRDAQDIRAILEDDWDESFDEESPKKSPPKTSRFDLSAFMQDGTHSSSSSPTFSTALCYTSAAFANSSQTSQAAEDAVNMISESGYPPQYQHQLEPIGPYMDTQQSAPPFNAPYAVRNLLSNSMDYDSESQITNSFSQDHDTLVKIPVKAHESTKENVKGLELDKSAVALNLSVTPSVLPASSSFPTQRNNQNQTSGIKKGSIFKSRAIAQTSGDVKGDGCQGNPKKRLALYKHKFGQGDGDDDTKAAQESSHASVSANVYPDEFDEDSDPEDLAYMSRVAKSDGGGDGFKVLCKKNAKKLYSVIRNVKPIHELQESGEFHEFDGDVMYILEELKDKNLMTNRCLSAITLATRCMEPAFRMHLRAHGTVAEFCKELHDAPSNAILALLASSVLFVLSQDRLNMDLDTDSLKLIIALTKAGETAVPVEESPEIIKLRQRVFDLVQEMKNRGHAKHLKVEKITASELALETLLYLTSKRAGEWVKHELRTLGGLDYIVTEVVTSLEWLKSELTTSGFSENVIERSWKIDRCLRVLQQVTFNHEENQRYLLGVAKGNHCDREKLNETPDIFIALFRFCSDKLAVVDRELECAKVLREILFSVLRVLVNLSHDYRGIVIGSEILCDKEGFLPLCLHSVFYMPAVIPDEKIFDLLMHSLCMLLNLVEYSKVNRNAILSSTVKRAGAAVHHSWSSEDSGVEEEQPTLDALVEMFVAKERAAKQDEACTDDILTKGSDSQKDSQKSSSSQNSQNPQNSQDESTNSVQDTIDKLIQTAGKHMENSLIAAYVSLLLAYLIMDDPVAAETVRQSMPNKKYLPLMVVLKKLFNFMSITSSASGSLRGLKATAIALKFYAKSDPHSNEELKKILPD